MAVTVKIPAQLRASTGGEPEAEADGSTVGEVLDSLFEQFAELRERICDDGDLRRFVNVYVGGEDIRFLSGLETEVSDGDDVTILPRSGRRGRGPCCPASAARGATRWRTRRSVRPRRRPRR